MAHLKSLTPKNPSPVFVFLQWLILIGVAGTLGLYSVLNTDWSNWVKLPVASFVFVVVLNLFAALIVVFRAPDSYSRIEKAILYLACIELGILAALPLLAMLYFLLGYLASLLNII